MMRRLVVPLSSALGRTAARWVATAVACMLIAACSSSVDLLSNLSEQEANESMEVLLAAHIHVEKAASKTGITLRVSSGDLAAALASLREHGLPRERFARMGEVFKKENLVSSPLEERARYLYALSQELEMTLSQIDGVVVARVQVVLPEQVSAIDPLTPASASVFLKYRPGAHLQPLVPQIRTLVASSVPGLSEERVAVSLIPAADINRHASPESAEPAASAASDASDASVWQRLTSSHWLKWLAWIGGVLALAVVVVGWLTSRVARLEDE